MREAPRFATPPATRPLARVAHREPVRGAPRFATGSRAGGPTAVLGYRSPTRAAGGAAAVHPERGIVGNDGYWARRRSGLLAAAADGVREGGLAPEPRDRLDLLLVTHAANVFYLTGFRGSAGMLLAGAGESTLIVDSRYVTAARRALEDASTPEEPVVLAEVETSYEEILCELLRARGRCRVGVEADHMTLARHAWIERTLAGSGVELHPTTGLVEGARQVKDARELEIMREAGARISEVMAETLAGLRPGRRERDVAADVDWAVRRGGFESPAFETIVASGPNSALPHARPGNRELAAGDLVLLDFGGVHEGYCVDMTRVASVGPPGRRAAAWHDAVRAAHAAALAAVRPGARAVAVDGAARTALVDRGLGDAFGHGTGHGLGIEVHEAPRIGKPRPDDGPDEVRLAPGMVVTVEPGVYLPGEGGVRLEDDVAVTETGCELLTDVPLDLVVV